MKVISFLIALISSTCSYSQCTYLAYDAFDYNNGLPLNSLSGGTGWLYPWEVQNGNISIPGYQTVNNSLSFGDLQNLGNCNSGGRDYLTSGRRLNTTSNGPFSAMVQSNNEGIGTATGQTLWVSMLLNKEQNNDQAVFADLHNNNISWCSNCGNQHIAVGYFGSDSNVSGQRRWSLRLNNNIYPTNVQIQQGTPVLLVLRIVFVNGNTQVDLYVNPSTLGNAGPPSADISQTTGEGNIIRSMAVYLGDNQNNGSIDEIRFASSYACATPDPSVIVNLPPLASFTLQPTSGKIPLHVMLDGTASSDPEGQLLSYVWNFGDGSPSSTGSAVSHTFNTLGVIPVSLTVTDNLGLSHTTYRNLTLLDNNTFPCQSTVTCLQMASCNSENGRIRVNTSNTTFDLRNSSNNSISITNVNEFHALPPDRYTLYVAGTTSVCTDTFKLQIIRDSSTCAGWQPAVCTMDIGTNMSGFADWSVERPMKNLFKHIRNQILTFSTTSTCWDCQVSNQLLFDANGYPTFLPQNTSIGTTMVRYILSADGGNLRQDSAYVLLYDGIGTITLNGGISNLSSIPGRIQFSPSNNGNIWIHITESQLGNHIRNIRLLKLADEYSDIFTQPFNDVFLQKIEPFQVLRFMDWASTNGSPVTQWTGRSSSSYFTYSGDTGVPFETMIQLANQTGKDIWICVPHQANDNFVTQMATLFKNNLNGNLKIYLEYSNEVWNWIFAQAHYNNDNRPSNLSYGRAMAAKAGNIFRIWHDVFGSDRCRVKRVLGVQVGFNSLNEQILSQLKQDEWDYGSPTHYFGLDHSQSGNPVLTGSSTYLDVMTNAQNSWNSFRPSVKQDYYNIQIFGKEVITYEGGQHFVGNSFGQPYPYQNVMWQAQNSQEMYDMYDRMHDTIRSWGCRLATNFSLAGVQESVYGSWGVLADIDVQPPYTNTAKKYQALLDNLPQAICQNTNTWTGIENNLWSNICNWDKNKLPDSQTEVIIPSSSLYLPHVNINAQAKSVKLALNTSLMILTGFQLSIE